MSKVLVHKFKLPVFKGTVYIIVGNTTQAAIDWAEDKTSEVIAKPEHKKSIKAYAYCYLEENGKSTYMLFFSHTAKPGELAHEAKHMLNNAFVWYGHKLSPHNDEVECYYLGEIVNKCYNTIKRWKKKFAKAKPKQLNKKGLNAILP